MAVDGALLTGAKKPLVRSRSIVRTSLHVKLPFWQRLYTWPFALLYPIWLNVYLRQYERYLGSAEFTFLSLGGLITLNILAMLACQWSVDVKTMFTCQSVNDPYEAEVIKVIPDKHRGMSAICQLERSRPSAEYPRGKLWFSFQKSKYVYSESDNQFAKVVYPGDDCPPLSTFQQANGLSSEVEIEAALDKYGLNRFDIPLPTFVEMFKDHAVAPFFVFQIFCVGLWCLDDYWYYSLFTLVMLVGFESSVVFQRLRTITEFRSLSMKPYKLNVYRNKKWILIESDELIPGDLCSLVRTTDEDGGGVPCDMILVAGTCIVNEAMLSGESTPQLKESLHLRESTDKLDIEGTDKLHMLFGGTKILQVTPPPDSHHIATPDGGCLAYVLRTGFGTSQGKLVRMMVYSTERVTANNLEALLFILFLLVFAIAASGYVWIEGTKNESRKRSKIMLDCILIITSVVPPELPMELSLAVNSSLMALSKLAIFCTEPFRIPFAGKVDIICFDKTGTLTDEDLVVEGVSASIPSAADPKMLIDAIHAPPETSIVLAAAHALVKLDDDAGTIVGDPMERVAVESAGWELHCNDIVTPINTDVSDDGVVYGPRHIVIKRRFQFSSALRRMSTVAVYKTSSVSSHFVAVKGAPETIKSMLVNAPSYYDDTFKHFMRRGSRVLALAYRNLNVSQMTNAQLNALHRDEVERDLTFVGFLVFHCPLKSDSKAAVDMLNNSSHRVTMITGDNPLTACHVATELNILERDALILDCDEEERIPVLFWRSIDESIRIEMSPSVSALPTQLDNYDLCLSGPAMQHIQSNTPLMCELIRRAWVYARVSPSQKEFILTLMKSEGYTTLMCGDGTNDVGALKQAHVGVALLDGKPEDLVKISQRQYIDRLKKSYESQVSLASRFGMPAPQPPPALEAYMAEIRKKEAEAAKKERRARKRREEAALLQAETGAAATAATSAANGDTEATGAENSTGKLTQMLVDLEAEEDDVPQIKFGDASVAAPFTSKLSTVMAIPNIIRQGRCTLVATIQMYKILALNCLISAYSLSVLYLDGIKFGDFQATVLGILMAVCFMCISKATPREQLSKQRPQSNIFNWYIMLSVMGQFIIHIGSLIYVTREAKRFEPPADVIELEGEFKPTLLNTAVYLISLSMQVSTFAVNYQGYPFRESMRENKFLFRGLALVGGLAVVGALELSPELNEAIMFVKMPEKFKTTLVTTMAFDFIVAYLIEVVCDKLFADNKPKPIAKRLNDE
ncbi:P-type ATPase [Ramicandelaber brevisporus]|nr:P-type ATPase [Ramicandelaber brevisporus]